MQGISQKCIESVNAKTLFIDIPPSGGKPIRLSQSIGISDISQVELKQRVSNLSRACIKPSISFSDSKFNCADHRT